MFSKEIANALSKDIFYMIDQLKDEVVKKQFMIDSLEFKPSELNCDNFQDVDFVLNKLKDQLLNKVMSISNKLENDSFKDIIKKLTADNYEIRIEYGLDDEDNYIGDVCLYVFESDEDLKKRINEKTNILKIISLPEFGNSWENRCHLEDLLFHEQIDLHNISIKEAISSLKKLYEKLEFFSYS